MYLHILLQGNEGVSFENEEITTDEWTTEDERQSPTFNLESLFRTENEMSIGKTNFQYNISSLDGDHPILPIDDL